MEKYPIKFNGTWEGPSGYKLNYFDDNGNPVTDTALATQYSLPLLNQEWLSQFLSTCNQLVSITLPDYIITLRDNAFYGCGQLETVILSTPLQNIGSTAFYECLSLKSIYIPETVITMGDSVFLDTHSLSDIYTPASNVENLKTLLENSGNGHLTSLVKSAPSSGMPVRYLQKEGENFIPIAHADSTYLDEETEAGKSKTVSEKFEEKLDIEAFEAFGIKKQVYLTEAEYEALAEKDPNTNYKIFES